MSPVQLLAIVCLSANAMAISACGQDTQSSPATRPVPDWVTVPQDSIPDPKPGMTISQVVALLKEKDPFFKRVFLFISIFMPLNDEHQGEGGTLVFVAVYITINHFRLQGFET